MGLIHHLFLLGALIYAVKGQGRIPGLPRQRMDRETMALIQELTALEKRLEALGIKNRHRFGSSLGLQNNVPGSGNFEQRNVLGSQNDIQGRINGQQPLLTSTGLNNILPPNNQRSSPSDGFLQQTKFNNNVLPRNNRPPSRNMFATTTEAPNIQPLTNDYAQLMQSLGGNGLAPVRHNNQLQNNGGNGLRIRENISSQNPNNNVINPGIRNRGTQSPPMGSSNDMFNSINAAGANPSGISNIFGPTPPRILDGLASLIPSGSRSPQQPKGPGSAQTPNTGPGGGPMPGLNPLLAGFATRNQMLDALDTHRDNMADMVEYMADRRRAAMLASLSPGMLHGSLPRGTLPGSSPGGLNMGMLMLG